MKDKVTKGDLMEAAKHERIDPEQSYEELRSAIDIKECKMCGDEYITGYKNGFCTDGCEVRYINEFYR